jgi:hypothetical protein
MLLDNHLELLSLYGGAAYGGLTLFGVNTGLRGEILAGVLNQSRARVLVVDERLCIQRWRRCAAISSRSRPRTSWSCRRRAAASTRLHDLRACLESEVGAGDDRSTRRRSTSPWRPISW